MSSSSPILVLFLITICTILLTSCLCLEETEDQPTPTPWPHQFHSTIVTSLNGTFQINDLWYDWPNGRNFNFIQYQLGTLLYNLEWTNGTSFLYTVDSDRYCFTLQFDVGILRPNWLEGATYLGQREKDGFLCNVWEKVDFFITYYEDVVSKRPVYWLLFTGKEAHIMTWEVGAVLEDAKWQVPAYCFDQNGDAKSYYSDGFNINFQQILSGPIRGSMQSYI